MAEVFYIFGRIIGIQYFFYVFAIHCWQIAEKEFLVKKTTEI